MIYRVSSYPYNYIVSYIWKRIICEMSYNLLIFIKDQDTKIQLMPPCSLEPCHDVISFDVLHLHTNSFIFFIFYNPNLIFVIPSISEKNGIKISRMQKKSSLIFFMYIYLYEVSQWKCFHIQIRLRESREAQFKKYSVN